MKKVLRWLAIPLVLAMLVGIGVLFGPSTPPADRDEISFGAPAPGASKSAKPAKDDPVAARVNGEAIRESDLVLALPKGTFDVDPEQARGVRLDRMIDALMVRQFLRQEKVEVAATEVDKVVEDLRKTPPAAGCACCRYASLEEFMAANCFDLKELRGLIANDLGFRKYLLAEWDRECAPGEARAKRVKEERSRIEEQYVKVSHVFFKTYQDPDYGKKPEEVRQKALAKAEAAWNDLEKGQAFEQVVNAVSEDAVSKPVGGSLGCVTTFSFGKDFGLAALALKPGEHSKPFETPWGWHVVRRDAMTDSDVSDLLRSEWLDLKQADVLNTIKGNARVER